MAAGRGRARAEHAVEEGRAEDVAAEGPAGRGVADHRGGGFRACHDLEDEVERSAPA
jgi:hypothetical protein